MVGYNNEGAGVSECYNTGSVESIGRDYVGGVAGSNDSTINDSYNIGDVTGNSYVGGVSGDNFGTVSGSYNTGKVDGYDDVGGVVGVNNSSVTNSYYLEGVAADNGFGEMKTAAQFASGEVAYLLQDAQEEVEGVKPQVWGQTLSGETPDQYPALTGMGTDAFGRDAGSVPGAHRRQRKVGAESIVYDRRRDRGFLHRIRGGLR